MSGVIKISLKFLVMTVWQFFIVSKDAGNKNGDV